MIKYSPSISCDINNVTGICAIVKTCSAKITTIANNFKDIYIHLNNTYVSRDAQASCQLVPSFILNKDIHPFGISHPKYHCFMNYVIQLHFSILRTSSHNFQFNSSTGGSLSEFLYETAHSASSFTDVDAFKFRLVQYDKFYGGQNQEDSSGCLMMLIKLISKGSVPY